MRGCCRCIGLVVDAAVARLNAAVQYLVEQAFDRSGIANLLNDGDDTSSTGDHLSDDAIMDHLNHIRDGLVDEERRKQAGEHSTDERLGDGGE